MLPQRVGTKSKSKFTRRYFRRLFKKSQKRIIRYGILTANLVLLVGVVLFVVQNPNASTAASQNSLSDNQVAADPLDQLSSAEIAVHVAQITNMDVEETRAIVNEADSANALLSMAASNGNIISKPQVVNTALKSNKDIQKYTVAEGDTLASIAAKFSVTSDSVKWSNGITGSAVTPGKQLLISPISNGIVYIVKSGDTADTLAQKFHSNKDQIVAYNDAELAGLKVGEAIVIPDGTIVTAAVARASSFSYSGGWSSGFVPTYGGNTYARGYCTWYVASVIQVPNNWGNANTWAYGAARSGWTVSKTPIPGAIAQTSAGYAGHVGVVKQVSADGSMIIFSDMNGIAGFGRVGTSGWVPASQFQNYLYR